jgi:hypothetical protein
MPIAHTPQLLSASATTDNAGLVCFRDRMYLFYKGEIDDDSLWWRCFDGNKWGCQEEIPGISTDVSPVVVSCPTSILLVWRDARSEQRSYRCLRFDPTKGSPAADTASQIPLAIDSEEAPSIARVGNDIYMAWRDCTDGQIQLARFGDNTWAQIRTCSKLTTPHRPVLGASQGRLHVYWVDQGKEQPGSARPHTSEKPICCARLSDTDWVEQHYVSEARSAAGPSVANYRGGTYLFWAQGQRVHWTFFRPGKGDTLDTWRHPSPLAWAASDEAPAVAVLGDQLHFVWREPGESSIHWTVDPLDERLIGLRWKEVREQVGPLAQVVSVLGVLLYAIARISIQAFYSEFGISPDTAGQSYLSTVLPVAVALATFVLIYTLILSVTLLVSHMPSGGRFIGRLGQMLYRWPMRRNRAIEEKTARLWGVYLLSSASLAVIAFVFLILDFSHVYRVDPYIDVALAAVVFVPLVSIVAQWWVSGGRRPFGITLLAVGLVAIVGVGVLARAYGTSEGRWARRGLPLHNTLAGFAFPPLSATPIEVQLINPATGSPQPRPFQPSDCLRELGEANGYVVLFDVPIHTVFKLPQGSVVLSQVTGANPGCAKGTTQ